MPSPATTSGTSTYSQTASKLIYLAYRALDIIAEGETVNSDESQDAFDSLEAMIKGWQAAQIHLWCEEEAILFPQANQTQYQLGASTTDKFTLYQQLTQSTLSATSAAGATVLTPASTTGMNAGDNFGVQLDSGMNFWTTLASPPSGGTVTLSAALPSSATAPAIVWDYPTPLVRPLRVYTGRRYVYNSKTETPMISMSRIDYANQPNKFNTGTITQFFFDPQTGQGRYSLPGTALFNLWPTPNSYFSGFRFTAQRPIQDFGNLTNLPDLPQEWMAAIRWNLAMELAPMYSIPERVMTMVASRAKYWWDMVSEWDKEPEAVLFGVAFEPGYRVG